jgi:hypothetical protein
MGAVSLLWGWPKERGGKLAEKRECEAESEKNECRRNGSEWTNGLV